MLRMSISYKYVQYVYVCPMHIFSHICKVYKSKQEQGEHENSSKDIFAMATDRHLFPCVFLVYISSCFPSCHYFTLSTVSSCLLHPGVSYYLQPPFVLLLYYFCKSVSSFVPCQIVFCVCVFVPVHLTGVPRLVNILSFLFLDFSSLFVESY